MIRFDFPTSGWTTPRRVPAPIETNHTAFADLWAKKTERLLASDPGLSRTRIEVRRLEDKVAKVASKRCSVEEVSALHRELEDWLASGAGDDQVRRSVAASPQNLTRSLDIPPLERRITAGHSHEPPRTF